MPSKGKMSFTERIRAALHRGPLCLFALALGCAQDGKSNYMTRSDVTSATITRIFLLNGRREPQPKMTTVTDKAELHRLLSYFPGAGAGKRSSWAGGWMTGVEVVFY